MPFCARNCLIPLRMRSSSYTAEAIKAAPNHAGGYRYAPDGSVEVPFESIVPLCLRRRGRHQLHTVLIRLTQYSFLNVFPAVHTYENYSRAAPNRIWSGVSCPKQILFSRA